MRYEGAKSGIEVVVLDTAQEAAERGKAYSQGLLDKAVKKGRSTPDRRDALLARITPTTSYESLAGCDLVIEAVFEDRAVKAEVTRRTEAVIGTGAVFASNTSTLPITGLAQASNRPANFIGLHFFSPVDKMPLVEIIVGRQTSDETLARGFNFVMQIGKTPIVVNDSRGFFTSRVFGTYVVEGLAMLAEVAIGSYLAALKEGFLLGARCAHCRKTVIPPRVVCEWCFRPMEKYIPLSDTGTVNTFSLCYVTWDVQRIKIPEIPAVIEIDGASPLLGIMHKLGDVDPTSVLIGMRVQAVWKPPEQRQGAITDILYFKPVK